MNCNYTPASQRLLAVRPWTIAQFSHRLIAALKELEVSPKGKDISCFVAWDITDTGVNGQLEVLRAEENWSL